ARFRVVGTDSSSSDNRTKTPVGSDILRRNRPAASPLRGQNPMKPRKIPRGTFWIGGLAALALGLPLTTLALAFLAERLHIGRPDATQAQIGLMAAIFAGLPAFLTGGGVARLVAHRLAESPAPRVWRGLVLAVLAMALGGIGIMVLAAVP